MDVFKINMSSKKKSVENKIFLKFCYFHTFHTN